MINKPQIIVADDEAGIRQLLKGRLEREGYTVKPCENAFEVERVLGGNEKTAILVTDIKMPGKDGLQLLKEIKEKHPQIKVIVITGHGEKQAAVQALRYGASNYLEKPFDMEDFMHSINTCMREYNLEKENEDLLSRLEARVERVEGKTEDQYWFVSKSKSMSNTNEWLNILRRESMRGEAEEPSVIILGESGTGKEGIARMVHLGSRRGKGPWVAVNCANFSEQLLESELFGHEKGSFTGAGQAKRGLFEIARDGTLFLDEIGEMDIKLQSKLLRVLQEKVFRRVGGVADIESNVRIIAATNKNLEEKTKSGSFREDLYHRLTKVVLTLPALRERNEDIIPMSKQFAEHAFKSRGKHFEGFTPEAEFSLQNYPWPGNVRELLNVIDRIALVWQGTGVVSEQHLSLPASPYLNRGGQSTSSSLRSVVSPFQTPQSEGVQSYMELKKKWTESFEKEYLSSALARHSGNVSAAAREAQLDRSNFLRLLRRYGIQSIQFRKAA